MRGVTNTDGEVENISTEIVWKAKTKMWGADLVYDLQNVPLTNVIFDYNWLPFDSG